MSTIDRDRRTSDYGVDHDDAVAPGRGTLTSRLVPPSRQTFVFRVENAEAANALADRLVQRDANGVSSGADVAIDRAASSSGSPLPGAVRDQFESSTGADLSSVRVHTGAESAAAAGAVGAHAYTVGQDIHFGDGKFAPSDPFGLHLLAHEVAHTVQQQGGTPSRQNKLEVSSPGDAMELEADRAADAMVRGASAEIGGASGTARKVARKTGDDAWWKNVIIQYQAFLKQAGGDQKKALELLKGQLGGAYPGDDVVLAKVGGGAAKPADAPADPNAPVGPTVDPPADQGGTCDPNKPDPAPADDGGTCDPANPAKEDAPANDNESEGGEAKKEGGEGEKKEGEGKEGEGPGVGAEVTPLKIGGVDLGLKVTAEGAEIAVTRELPIEIPGIPVCAGVKLVIEPKIKAQVKVSWTKAAGWVGSIGLGGELGVFLRGGVDCAYIEAGGAVEVMLTAPVTSAGVGTFTGDLKGKLSVDATVKVPYTAKDKKEEAPNLKDPEGWLSQGGVKFEWVIAEAPLVHIEIGKTCSAKYIGPDLSSHTNALDTWKQEYERNFAGGGQSGAAPYGAEGPSYDHDNNGAGGSHG
jgi:hypothetical protein